MAASPGHRLQYALVCAAAASLGRLSWDGRAAWGRRLGGLWWRLDGRRRRIATDNLRQAFPDWPTSRVAGVARDNFAHLGVTVGEVLGLPRMGAEELLARTGFLGLEHLDRALARGRGVLVLTGHQGNWELGGLALAASGYPVYAIGRRLSNPLVNARVVALRQRFGGTLIPHRQAVRPVLRALRRDGIVAFLMDQKSSAREAVPSRFFGRPVATNQGLALLALKTGAPVVPGFDERVGGHHAVRFGAPLELPASGSREERVRAATELFDQTIEEAVRRCPSQWFWIHRRWRLPRDWTG